MSKSTPSLLALLGLVAVAGYQNRGRISEMMSDAHENSRALAPSAVPTTGGFLSEIGQLFQSNPTGRTISSALGDLVERFKAAGQGSATDSWVSDRPNQPVGVDDLAAALGDDTLGELEHKTGMTHEELLLRLNAALPEVVNRFTPNGRFPTDSEAMSLV